MQAASAELKFGIGGAPPIFGVNVRAGRPPPSCSTVRGSHCLTSPEASPQFQSRSLPNPFADSPLPSPRQRSSSPPLFPNRCPSSESAASSNFWHERSPSFSSRSPRSHDTFVRCSSHTVTVADLPFPNGRSLSFTPVTREVDMNCRTPIRAPPPITRCPSMHVTSPPSRTRSSSFRSRSSGPGSDAGSLSPRQVPSALVRCSSREGPLIRQYHRGNEDIPRQQAGMVKSHSEGILMSRAIRQHSFDRGTAFMPRALSRQVDGHTLEHGMNQVRTYGRTDSSNNVVTGLFEALEADSRSTERERNRQRLADAIELKKRAKARLHASPGLSMPAKDISNIRARAAARLASSSVGEQAHIDADPRLLGLGGACSVEEEIEFKPISDDDDFDDIIDWPASAATNFVERFRALSPRRETSPLRFLEPVMDHLDKAKDVVTRPCVQRKKQPSRQNISRTMQEKPFY